MMLHQVPSSITSRRQVRLYARLSRRPASAPADIRSSCRLAQSQTACLGHVSQRWAASILATMLLLQGIGLTPSPYDAPALAVLVSPNAQIARSADAALRRATPAFNDDVKTAQRKLEDIQFLLRIPQRKPWGGMAIDVQAAQGLVSSRVKMMRGIPNDAEVEAQKLLEELDGQLERLQFAIDRKDQDKTSVAVAAALKSVERLEIIQVRSCQCHTSSIPVQQRSFWRGLVGSRGWTL
jgi:hypothetical protein